MVISVKMDGGILEHFLLMLLSTSPQEMLDCILLVERLRMRRNICMLQLVG